MAFRYAWRLRSGLPAHQHRTPCEAAAHRLEQHQVALLDAAVGDGDGERQRHGSGRRVAVKLSSFATFHVRSKNERIGRNPKTGEEVPILPRRVMTFKASNVLKSRILRTHQNSKAKSRK